MMEEKTSQREEDGLLQILPELLEELAVSWQTVQKDASCGRQAHAWL